MKKTYTEQEIKDWFTYMIKKYHNCPTSQHLQSVYDEMFNPFWERNNLQTVVEKGRNCFMREFNYVNDLGFHKRIVVGIKKNGKYPITLWDMEHGECCGSGNVTAQKLNEFLEHYGIKERME